MNQNINFNSQFPVLNTINQVDGFDPSKLTVDYVDLTTQEKRKRLPVMAQLAWFRLRHPEGKIALHVEPVKDYFVATARVYVSYKDPADCYLSEATASRKYDPEAYRFSPGMGADCGNRYCPSQRRFRFTVQCCRRWFRRQCP